MTDPVYSGGLDTMHLSAVKSVRSFSNGPVGPLEKELHCVWKNDTDVARYNFNVDQPILIVFRRDVAERVCYQKVICYPTSPN